MRTALLLGLVVLTTSVAAQTVKLPAPDSQQAKALREKEMNATAKSAAIANRMDAVNESGAAGYDIVTFDSRTRSVRGTPFLLTSWSMGEIVLTASAKPISGVLKFDVYHQQLRIVRPQGDSMIVAPERLLGFTLRPTGPEGKPIERKFERMPIGLLVDFPVAFAELLSAGNAVRLLKLYQKNIINGGPISGYGVSGPVDSFQGSTQYYLRWADGTATPVKSSKAAILAAVAVRNPAAVAALAPDKAKVRTDAELSGLIEQLNTALAAN